MFYKLGKKVFLFLKDSLYFSQICLVLLAFAIILYWILSLAQVPFVAFAAPFFDGIKDIIHLFYSRNVDFETATVDFSFLIASILSLLIVWLINFAVEFVSKVETKYDWIHNKLKQKEEESFNKTLEKDYKKDEKKNNKLIALIEFSIVDLSHDDFYTKKSEKDFSEDAKNILTVFWEGLSEKIKFKETFINEKLALFFDKFDDVDNIILQIKKEVDGIKNEYLQKNWKIDAFITVETYSSEDEIIEKVKKLKKLINIRFKNEILCLATFAQRYALISDPEYFLELKGVYKIENEEEVFSIKHLSK